MPVYENDGGTAREVDPRQNVSGADEPIRAVYVNQSGTPVEVYRRQEIVFDCDGGGGIADFSVTDSGFAQVTGAAHDGSHGLRQTDFGVNESYPNDGLEHYPQPGDTWEIWHRFETIGSGDYQSIRFAVYPNNTDTYLTLAYDEGGGRIVGEEIVNGSVVNEVFDTFEDTGTKLFGGTTWWKSEVHWHSNSLVYRLYDNNEAEVYDSGERWFDESWNKGGIMLRGGGGGTVSDWDSWIITDPA